MRFYLLTLGCPKNQVDSETMSELLRSQGHVPVPMPADADLLIVNTCGFLSAAREEALAELRQLAADKRADQLLVAAGCMAQRDGEEIVREIPKVSGLLGTRRWMEIDTLVMQLSEPQTMNTRPALLEDPACPPLTVMPRPTPSGGWSYIKISDGCDASCSFCTIPAIKGPLRSRPVSQLLVEAQDLVAGGAQELILIGQDTTAYGRDLGLSDGLPLLVSTLLAGIAELRWLRLMYAFPGHVSERLVDVMASDPRVCHYLDLPLQHGHPDTLRRMRRPSNAEGTVKLIERLRTAMPDIALRSTFIVGYPGETDTEFQALLNFAATTQLDKVGVFKFSAESGTVAAELPDTVPEEVKQGRFERLMTLQRRISLQRNREQIGRRLDVLVEGTGDGISMGRSYRDAPEIDGMVLIPVQLPLARMVPVVITGAMDYDLVGEVA